MNREMQADIVILGAEQAVQPPPSPLPNPEKPSS